MPGGYRRLSALLGMTLLLASVTISFADSDLDSPFIPDIPNIRRQQKDILERSKHLVDAGIPGVAELFVIGVAADADSAVFEEEVRAALLALDTRFTLGKRFLLLLNSYREQTLSEWPLASKDSLQEALILMGRKMNEEDVLLLLLSGHGDSEEGLFFSFAEQEQESLQPGDLYGFLNAASIPASLTVATGCYTGVFAPLKALPAHGFITAASKDRRSFGCQHSRQYTYFGEAFFLKALPQASSIEALIEKTMSYNRELEDLHQVTPAKPVFRVSLEVRRAFNRIFERREKHAQ